MGKEDRKKERKKERKMDICATLGLAIPSPGHGFTTKAGQSPFTKPLSIMVKPNPSLPLAKRGPTRFACGHIARQNRDSDSYVLNPNLNWESYQPFLVPLRLLN